MDALMDELQRKHAGLERVIEQAGRESRFAKLPV
jgi:hypothetical protein